MSDTGDRRSVLLLSGGLDSATCLLIAREEGREVFALSFDYSQRHSIELERARGLARRYGVREHRVLRLELPEPRLFGPDGLLARRTEREPGAGVDPGHLRPGTQHDLPGSGGGVGRGSRLRQTS